jgi:hypothetical protein
LGSAELQFETQEVAMEQWILDLAKRHRDLRGYDYRTPGELGQKEMLWSQFTASCDAGVRTYGNCFGRPLFVVAEQRHEGVRSCVVAEHNPDNVQLTLTFNEEAGCFEIRKPTEAAGFRLRLVLDENNEIRMEYRRRLFGPEEAARLVLTPLFFGVAVYIPPQGETPGSTVGSDGK